MSHLSFIINIKQNVCHFILYAILKFILLVFLISCNSPDVPKEITQENQLDSTMVKGSEIDGEKNGEWISYFPNGNIQSICHFNKGVPNGPIIVYNENGSTLYRGNFNNGDKVGEWIFYDSTGNRIVKSYKD